MGHRSKQVCGVLRTPSGFGAAELFLSLSPLRDIAVYHSLHLDLFFLLYFFVGFTTDQKLLLHKGRKHALEGPKRLLQLQTRLKVRFPDICFLWSSMWMYCCIISLILLVNTTRKPILYLILARLLKLLYIFYHYGWLLRFPCYISTIYPNNVGWRV